MPDRLITMISPQPIDDQPSGLKVGKKSSKRKIIFWVIGIVFSLIVGGIAAAFLWYNVQLGPVGIDKGQLVIVKIAPGSTPVQIGDELKKQSIIRSSSVFNLYIRLSGKNNSLQAGTYR